MLANLNKSFDIRNNFQLDSKFVIQALNDTDKKLSLAVEDSLFEAIATLIETSVPGKRFCYQVYFYITIS
jgi:hypothetical protein